jgi:hypothetical protein
MADFPQPNVDAPPFLHTWSRYSCLRELKVVTGAAVVAVGTVDPTADNIHYMPMSIPFPYLCRRAFWVNGTTAAGSRDFGIFARDGRQIYSTGSTLDSGTSAPQFVSIATPFILYPGDYYFAWLTSSATNSAFGAVSTIPLERMVGIKGQAKAIPLPTSATFATPAVAGVELCGVSWTPSGF